MILKADAPPPFPPSSHGTLPPFLGVILNGSILPKADVSLRGSEWPRLRTVLKVRLPCASEVKLPSVQISVAVATSGDNRVNALSGANHLS